ncbi:MAG: GxxExxY protein [Anaerolineales bacterium]|nr:GxxExxY protein [Anaerolineales bacterium]
MEDQQLNELSHSIIGCAYKVMNQLGVGFLEKVYENALAFELRTAGFHVVQQKPLNVYYSGIIVGEYIADLVVENKVIVELRGVKILDNMHTAQCVNYLKATNLELALLLNFATREVGVRRVIRSQKLLE